MADFLMPSLGAGMEAGTLAKWRRAIGDRVARGDILAEVETEKGLIEVEVFTPGVVSALLVAEGTKVPVGARLAVIEEAAVTRSDEPPPASRDAAAAAAVIDAVTDVAAPTPSWATGAPAAPVRATPSARRLAREVGLDPRAIAASGAHGTLTRRDVLCATEAEPSAAPPRPRVSPYARRRAAALGVDLSCVAPGPDGVIHARDVEAAAVAPAKPDPARAMRRAIAAAMSRSKREIPHYYLAHTIDLGPALARLAALNAARSPTERLVPGVLLLSAAARALAAAPELNGHWTGEGATPSARVHLGVAITLRGGGLVAPAIHDAASATLDELMQRLSDLVARARRGQLRASELADPTITVTSLGERGVETVYGVIHPPQVAMVGFGKIVTRPWVVGDAVVARPTVTVTLAADHRVSDGHRGGLYLAEIERLLSSPEEP
ncbi:MAG: 2-oxo acid dehydrogenase subunit E2 [Sandaracinaceae bacterium]|nr:2-oxo acid dehydrogenase subunit E2 [Sandaracinaceae bacterium]